MGGIEITLKGRTYQVRYLMGGLLRFEQRTGQDVSEANLGRYVTAVTLLYCCLEATCRADGIALEATLEEAADAIDAPTLLAFMRMVGRESAEGAGNVQSPTPTEVPGGKG